RADHALRADLAVELVLDLDQAGGELPVFPVRALDADLFIRRIRAHERLLDAAAVGFQAVAARGDRGLRVGLVAQAPHAQRGRVRPVARVAGERLPATPRPLVR